MIRDPHNILQTLQTKLQNPSFESLFQIGQKAIYDKYVEKCEIGCQDPNQTGMSGCWSSCTKRTLEVVREVHSISGGKAVIISNQGDYEEFSEDSVRLCKGNLAIPFMEQLSSLLNVEGQLTIEKLTEYKLPINNGTRSIQAYSLWGQFLMTGYKTSFNVKVVVSPEAGGTGQIVMFSALNDVYFKLVGLP